jgi:ectoine hydroxylase-related dioxygenase (phytanoyl-CoA dioxygenase family)
VARYSKADVKQIIKFEENGYVRVNGLLKPDEVDLLYKIAKADHELINESYGRRDASGQTTRLTLRNDLDDSTIYAAIVRSQRVAGTMELLLGDEVYHYHHKVMLKEPRVGGAWEWHQDYGYWYDFGCLFPDMASCLIAIDPATRANGCLQILRGSHQMGRINHGRTGEQAGADPQRVEAALKRFKLVHCELDPGDALFFHGNLLHCSQQNTSDNPRWSLICCYNTEHNDPIVRDGRHPNYSFMEKWPDERVLEVGQTHWETLCAARG